MKIAQIDLIIIVFYLILVALIGSFSGGKQKSTHDYFMGGENVPWWAVSFSIVAAETSSLTFISIPGLAYLTDLSFLQLTIGYIIARILVAVFFLPAYRKGELATAYTYLEARFGRTSRRTASTVFLFTRVAADGVRLFSTAIPLAIIFGTFSYFETWDNFQIYLAAIIIIAVISFIYTFTGGVKGVIWADVLQMFIYIGGAILALIVLFDGTSASFSWSGLGLKTRIFNFDFGQTLGEFINKPYTFVASVLGGTFLSMASHGTDQLIVQRLLTTKTLRESQKAIVVSGVMVFVQFALFLVVGLFLYHFFEGISLDNPQTPFHRADEIFPYFIVHYLPDGIKGIIIAGLFAAAISTLAGSISSLSSALMLDLYRPLLAKKKNLMSELQISRMMTIFWAVVLTLVAIIFINIQQSMVEIALGIASITYGGLLGTFLLGLFFPEVKEKSAIIAFSAGIVTMVCIVLIPKLLGMAAIVHWTWFVVIGTCTTLIVGNLWQKLVTGNE